MSRRIYLDLDGVMADFDGTFPAVFGLDHRDMADDDMWLKINGHPSFFRDLPPMAGAVDFFRSIEHLEPIILTACPKSNYAHVATQKVEWVRAHLSAHVTVLPVLGGSSKPLFMHAKGDILIDDYRRNTEAWTASGGLAILHRGFEGTAAALEAAIGPYTPSNVSSATLAELVERFHAREAVGLAKYGTTLDRTDLSAADLRQHLLEELMDACMYLVAEQRAARRQLVAFRIVGRHTPYPWLDASQLDGTELIAGEGERIEYAYGSSRPAPVEVGRCTRCGEPIKYDELTGTTCACSRKLRQDWYDANLGLNPSVATPDEVTDEDVEAECVKQHGSIWRAFTGQAKAKLRIDIRAALAAQAHARKDRQGLDGSGGLTTVDYPLPEGYGVEEFLPGIWQWTFVENGEDTASLASYSTKEFAVIAAWKQELDIASPSAGAVVPAFQARVSTWMDQCFLPSLYSNMTERGDRLLEEVLELLQSKGYDASRVDTLVSYVWGRPVGEPAQEVGGVMVTLAGFCWIAGLDMHHAGDIELARINRPEVMANIRAKQEAKNALHFDTPLPGSAPEAPRD